MDGKGKISFEPVLCFPCQIAAVLVLVVYADKQLYSLGFPPLVLLVIL